jgi:hypothetical protein
VGPNGGIGAPWLKAGWHQAYLVLRDGVQDPVERGRVDALHERLVAVAGMPEPERLTLERELVSRLRSGCERVVAGYTLRTEPLNVDYSGGVENAAYDAQAGLGSAIFPRTVKLKDFPWNGWLTVGVPERPAAAWNPVAGFTDPAGRLLWLALGDPAFFPSPHGAGWIANRVTVASVDGRRADPFPSRRTPSPSRPAPAPPARSGPGVGRARASSTACWRPSSTTRPRWTRRTSSTRWGSPGEPRTPAVLRATARLREGLVALRVLRTETDVLAFGEDKLTYEVPIVEVFVDRAAATPADTALIAPPWTTVPWPVLALAEEAVSRSLAAFSRESAQARGVPWLDLARDRALGPRLRALLDELAARPHVPAALAGRVTPADAGARWAALRAFHDALGHLLVTNGPYRLVSWTDDTSVLQVFRDLSYPRGLGVFNSHAHRSAPS